MFRRSIAAGMGLFASVWVAGFGLGILRVLWLAPRTGDVWATLLELPLILAVAWVACGWMIRTLGVPDAAAARLLMGGVALGLLLSAEVALAWWMQGQEFFAFLRGLGEPAKAIGLAGQVVFGAMPLLWRGRSVGSDTPARHDDA